MTCNIIGYSDMLHHALHLDTMHGFHFVYPTLNCRKA